MQNTAPQKKPLLNYINVFRGLAIIMILFMGAISIKSFINRG